MGFYQGFHLRGSLMVDAPRQSFGFGVFHIGSHVCNLSTRYLKL